MIIYVQMYYIKNQNFFTSYSKTDHIKTESEGEPKFFMNHWVIGLIWYN